MESVYGHDGARVPANDMANVVATDTPVETGAKVAVSCRVGPNNADTKYVDGCTYATWAFVHLFHVAVEYVTVSPSILTCCTYKVHTCLWDPNPSS